MEILETARQIGLTSLVVTEIHNTAELDFEFFVTLGQAAVYPKAARITFR